MTEIKKTQLITKSTAETLSLGKQLGKNLRENDVLCITGELGAGKTTLIKGLAQGMGLKGIQDEVSSPTFVLIRQYPCRIPLFHVDLYRLDSIGEVDSEMILECMEKRSVVAVEWGEKALPLFPKKHLKIRIDYLTLNNRKVTFESQGGFAMERVPTKAA